MDPSTWLTSYPAVYFTLAFAGFPLPIPEDGVLMVIGLSMGEGHLDPRLTIPLCYLGVMTRDSVLYWTGHLFGRRILQHRWVQKVMGAKLARAQSWLLKEGRRTVFIARFLPAVKVSTYLMAGSMGMQARHFYAADMLGAVFSVSISLSVGYFLGPSAIELWTSSPVVKAVTVLVVALFVIVTVRRALREPAEAA